jgi:CHASE1-domain containing sensor protein
MMRGSDIRTNRFWPAVFLIVVVLLSLGVMATSRTLW